MSQVIEKPSEIRALDDGSETEDETEAIAKRKEAELGNLSLSGDLSCVICLNLLKHPYTIVPCLHTFDKECLSEWWRSNSNCPSCKEESKSARFSFQINSIMGYHREVKRRRLAPEASESQPEKNSGSRTSEEIFPFGRGGEPAPVDEDSDHEGDNSDLDLDQADEGEEIPVLPPAIIPVEVGSLQPCPCCVQDNTTGYHCEVPMTIIPPDENLPPLRRGEARLSVIDSTTMQFRSDTAAAHRHCDTCTAYVPVNNAPVQCQVCKIYTCAPLDEDGCPRASRIGVWDPVILNRYDDVHLRIAFPNVTDFGQIWEWCEPPLYHNLSERSRFVAYMTGGQRSPQEVLIDFENSLKRWLLQQSRVPPRRQRDSDAIVESVNVIADRIAASNRPALARGTALGPAAPDPETERHWRVCYQCIMTNAKPHFFRWWSQERATGQLDPAVMALDHCWYGRECRTQTHNHNHASRYNHICDNTSMARGRHRAQAGPP
ncbi:hypothetical protein DL93DRAFT_2223102 [Clavulina sp. PMI_390]|nr:hypothetical protein DL93DRAFT_2223102 [Clavulina sp. PMI_390]